MTPSWWRHDTETLSELLEFCKGSPVTGGPSQRDCNAESDVFFVLFLNNSRIARD